MSIKYKTVPTLRITVILRVRTNRLGECTTLTSRQRFDTMEQANATMKAEKERIATAMKSVYSSHPAECDILTIGDSIVNVRDIIAADFAVNPVHEPVEDDDDTPEEPMNDTDAADGGIKLNGAQCVPDEDDDDRMDNSFNC